METNSIRHLLELVFSSESVNCIERTGKGTAHDLLETRVGSARFTISEHGRTFVTCSGQVIASFGPSNGPRAIHLVLDDGDGEHWDSRRASALAGLCSRCGLEEGVHGHGEAGFGTPKRVAHPFERIELVGGLPGGPRPSPRLRLVQSA
jgi:hypothetical protein